MKPTKRDYSQLIIMSALAVTVTRYAGAFVASDVGIITGFWSTVLTVLMAISGVGMGVLDVLGLAYVFDGWRSNLPRAGGNWSSRFKVLTGFVVLLVITGLGILTPFTVARIKSESMETVLGDVPGLWALAVNLAPFLIIGGVIFSQAGFVTVNKQEAQPESHRKETERNGNNRKSPVSFRTLPAEDRALIAEMTAYEIARKYDVSERTGRTWRKLAKGG